VYAPDPAGEANSAPQTLWLDFRDKRGKGRERAGGEGQRKGKVKEVKGNTGVARGCGPHRAALARGDKRAKIVFKNSREN